MVPVLVVERFEVYDGANPASRLARGREILLFPGFQIDLDTGQIVPEGMGGDLIFTARGLDDGTIGPRGTARLASLTSLPTLPGGLPGAPSPGKAVLPGDFAGRFRLIANGQWSGLLELAIDPAAAVSGTFVSDASGTVYPVSGKVDGEVPQKIRFAIEFPRTRQDYEGLLWSAQERDRRHAEDARPRVQLRRRPRRHETRPGRKRRGNRSSPLPIGRNAGFASKCPLARIAIALAPTRVS